MSACHRRVLPGTSSNSTTGDAENSLVMPEADADEGKVLEQAEVIGITDIRVTKLVHEHEPGTTPGHYQQP